MKYVSVLFIVFSVILSAMKLACPDLQPNYSEKIRTHYQNSSTILPLLTLLNVTFSALNSWCLLSSISYFNIVKNNKYGWLGNYKSWETAEKKCIGYNSTAILEKVLQTRF